MRRSGSRSAVTCGRSGTARDPVSEIVRLLETLIELVPDGTRARATALWVAAALHAVQRDLESADRMAQEALELGRGLGDPEVVEWSLLVRCQRLWYEGRWAESDAVAAEAYGLAAAMEMPFATMVALYSLASAKLLGGDGGQRARTPRTGPWR